VSLWFDPLFAADTATFPRGPGLYFNLLKLLPILGIYLVWIKTCSWIDRDAPEWKLPQSLWNPLMFVCGLIGLLIVWLLPWFLVSFPLLLLLYGIPSLAYVNLRNQKAPEDQQVLTQRHLLTLLRLKPPPAKQEAKQRNIPVRFIGKSFNQGEEDKSRVARAQENKGYRSALELVYDAIEARATDIHLEPTKDEMAVRWRIDGILQTAASFSRATGDLVLNIFKVLSALDITEKRKPQDGSFSAQVEDRVVDFRVATAGSVAGEKMVMRILDKSKAIADLTRLGMRDKLRDVVNEIVSQPHGMFIVCGPTGSGKSTTLYACMNEIDRYTKNVITVENPVEYQIANVTQIEVNPKAGKTFAGELRSILRQDPDVIYVGEIRDQETAEIACQAAQTGHMVFTTLHANDTVTAIARLLDLGVQPFLVSTAVTAVLGQRLVRVLCPKCKVRYTPSPDLLRKANLPADKIKFLYKPKVAEPGSGAPRGGGSEDGEEHGEAEEVVCPQCGGTGYYGRIGIFELLVLNDKIRELIRENPNFNAIRQEAVKTGMKYLQEDGLRQVIEGKTSIQELLRVSK
jgi:type II secretory ATPase GspE/PulE/Tfp pilus assembly ATPase PilB-like protein